MNKILPYISATSLVVGTCVGGGVLILPTQSSTFNFLPTFLYLTICWAFMLSTGLLLAEASCWMKDPKSHLFTMNRLLLGKFFGSIGVLLYLINNYSALIAYNAAGGEILKAFVRYISGGAYVLDYGINFLIYAILIGSVLFLRVRFIGLVNSLFVFLMFFLFVALLIGTSSKVSLSLLERFRWSGSYSILAIVFTSLSYHAVIPSISIFVKRDIKTVRFAIITGTTISYIVYIFWLLMVFGIVPQGGSEGLADAYRQGKTALVPFSQILGSDFLKVLLGLFSLVIVSTSYFGVGLSLFDLFADWTKMEKKGWDKILLVLLVVVPTLYFSMLYPAAVVFVLQMLGGVLAILVSAIIPLIMALRGRYKMGYQSAYQDRYLISKRGLTILSIISLILLGSQIVGWVFL